MQFEYQGEIVELANIRIAVPRTLAVNTDILISFNGKHPRSHCLINGEAYYIGGFDATNAEESGEIFLDLYKLG